MPEIIERGYLYIAQPPLYKVKRGQSELYLKDERALEDYLLNTGLEDAVFTTRDGMTHAGAELVHIGEQARDLVHAIESLNTKYNRTLVEQTAIVGGLVPEAVDDPEQAATIVTRVCNRLDRLADEVERGWQGETDGEGGMRFWRTVRGVDESHFIDRSLLQSADARKLRSMAERLDELYGGVAKLNRKDVETPIYGPFSLFAAITAAARKGISLQRYKGLGEMNPNQLWETTLDPNVRTLLQVQVKESDVADETFTQLMGDLVEPRREFIQGERAERGEFGYLIGCNRSGTGQRRRSSPIDLPCCSLFTPHKPATFSLNTMHERRSDTAPGRFHGFEADAGRPDCRGRQTPQIRAG